MYGCMSTVGVAASVIKITSGASWGQHSVIEVATVCGDGVFNSSFVFICMTTHIDGY